MRPTPTILKEYAKDQQFIAKLKTAQRAWLAFRGAQLEALFPKTDKQAEYGSVYPMCRCSELQSLTEERAKQLKRWLDGTKEGNVCAGSVRRAQSEASDQATIVKRLNN
jgi:Lysozyme inhibitor LprI